MDIKRTVLLTNDDGFHAPGIRLLYDVLSKVWDVVVVAPDKEQSGVGHAFTYNRPLHYEKSDTSDTMQGYKVSGSPADCVKFAVSYILPRKPDIVISGLNIGENSGLSAFYSGTVAAAREGAFWGIPSFAFSLCTESSSYASEYVSDAVQLIEKILDSHEIYPIEKGKIYYNINYPTCAPSQVKGTRITWQSMAYFDDRYERVEVESHASGEGFVICGEKKDIERSDAFDSRALMNNYIAITPLSFDSTAYGAIPHLRWLENKDPM